MLLLLHSSLFLPLSSGQLNAASGAFRLVRRKFLTWEGEEGEEKKKKKRNCLKKNIEITKEKTALGISQCWRCLHL